MASFAAGVLPGKVPTAPTWLRGAARKEWRRVAKQLAETGRLIELDRTALALYCEAFADYLEAAAIVQEEGMVAIDAEGSPVPHPAVLVRDDAWSRMMEAAQEFGMTPASRLTPFREK